MTRQAVIDLVASRSYVITMCDDERARLLAEVSELLDGDPVPNGNDEIQLPYVTRCTRVRLS
jgi:hypothetical protein